MSIFNLRCIDRWNNRPSNGLDQIRTYKLFKGRSPLISILTAECLGTFILVFIGNCSVAQKIAGGDLSVQSIDVNFAYGLGAAFGIYCSQGVSGGHINPAVSLAQFILGNITFVQLCFYVMGQFLGAFISACLTFAVYVDAINFVDPKYTIPGYECDPLNATATCSHTAGIFATYPTGFFPTSTFELLVDQVSFFFNFVQ